MVSLHEIQGLMYALNLPKEGNHKRFKGQKAVSDRCQLFRAIDRGIDGGSSDESYGLLSGLGQALALLLDYDWSKINKNNPDGPEGRHLAEADENLADLVVEFADWFSAFDEAIAVDGENTSFSWTSDFNRAAVIGLVTVALWVREGLLTAHDDSEPSQLSIVDDETFEDDSSELAKALNIDFSKNNSPNVVGGSSLGDKLAASSKNAAKKPKKLLIGAQALQNLMLLSKIAPDFVETSVDDDDLAVQVTLFGTGLTNQNVIDTLAMLNSLATDVDVSIIDNQLKLSIKISV